MQRVALIYDFDGTLSPGSMQEHTLIPNLGFKDAAAFWDKVKVRNREIDGDEVLTYMNLLLEAKPGVVSASTLREHGRSLPFFPGVVEWFSRVQTQSAP